MNLPLETLRIMGKQSKLQLRRNKKLTAASVKRSKALRKGLSKAKRDYLDRRNRN